MQIFINEFSLNGQYYTKEEFENSLKAITSIFYFLNQKVNNENNQIFGDFQLLSDYEAIKGFKFIAAYNKINMQLKQEFLKVVLGQGQGAGKSRSKNWRSEPIHSSQDSFVYLDIHDVSNTSIAEVTERTLQNPNNNYLLVNFINSIFCVDRLQHPDIRECFAIPIVKNNSKDVVKLDCLDNKSAIENWLRENQILKSPDLEDCLKDTTRFEKTSIIWQGRSVYREISTQYFWYLDNLHKSHFEIFDPTGKHHIRIGDLEGNSRESTKKEREGKKPII